MTYLPAKRDTLHIPSGPTGNHLFAIITDPSQEGTHLLVCFSSLKPGVHHDPACLVNVGEHPFVTVPSAVEYRFARVEPSAHLVKCVAGWTFKRGEPVSDALLQKIRDGVLKSRFATRFIKDYFTKNA